MNAASNQFATYHEKESSVDFLTELSRVCDDVVMLEGKKPVGTMEFDHVSGNSQKANKNISSIVSRIRDEGSAFDTVETESNNRSESGSTVNTNNVMKFDPRTVDKTEIKIDMDKFTQGQQSKTTESGEETTKLDTGVHKQAGFKSNLFLLFSYLLVAILLSGVVIMFYQIKVQSDDLKNTLILYKKVIRKNELNKKDIHSNKIYSKNKIFITPERLKNDLTKKTQTMTRLKGKMMPVKISKDEDNRLQKVMPPVTRRVDLKLISGSTSTQMPAPIIFAVNLASFSDQKKASQQLKKLQSDGVEAVIEAATIHGKKIFRLSVDGFSTRDEARVFILQARKKYGFEGWVRRS